MMSAVEVLEMSMDSTAALIMKASSKRACPPPVPMAFRIASESLRCSPVRSMARAMNAPPRSRNRIGA